VKNILTLKEVSERLKCSESMVRKQCALGRIPHSRIGSLWRFDADDIDRWIEEGIRGKGKPLAAVHGRN
jgi:excisionase family DNA binding protein